MMGEKDKRPNLIIDGVLFDSGNEGELASALEMFMGVDVDPVKMGLDGWAKVNRQFSVDAHLEGVENIYGMGLGE